MILKKIFLLIFALSFILSNRLYSQCSDAGICSIGSHETEDNNLIRPLNINLAFTFGTTGRPEEIVHRTFNLGATFDFSQNFSAMFTMPLSIISDSSNTVTGPGDLIFAIRKNFSVGAGSDLMFSVGGKFPTGKTSVDSLPLALQPGQGTKDILLAATFNRKEFFVGCGLQLPFGEVQNGNFNYKFKRAPDAIVRGGFNIYRDKYHFGLEAMYIKRLTYSKAVFESPTGIVEDPIVGSDFTQINILGKAGFNLSESVNLLLNAAFPVLQRSENIDGTKRALSFGIGLSFHPVF